MDMENKIKQDLSLINQREQTQIIKERKGKPED